MSLHFFAVPVRQPEPVQRELNEWLAGQRVLSLQRELVNDGGTALWAVCVEVVDGPGPLPPGLTVQGGRAGVPGKAGKGGVDYRQVFGDADFAVFVALRELRKRLAAAEGVPVYAVFTNEQLAAIVSTRVQSAAALGAIEGVGPARVQKYGGEVLGCLAHAWVPGAQPPAAPALSAVSTPAAASAMASA